MSLLSFKSNLNRDGEYSDQLKVVGSPTVSPISAIGKRTAEVQDRIGTAVIFTDR